MTLSQQAVRARLRRLSYHFRGLSDMTDDAELFAALGPVLNRVDGIESVLSDIRQAVLSHVVAAEGTHDLAGQRVGLARGNVSRMLRREPCNGLPPWLV